MRMNAPIFLVSKVGEDPQEFLDGGYKVLSAMGVTSKEKVELASYQFDGGCSSEVHPMERQ